MFWKRNLYSDSSRGTSTQMIMNEVPNNVKQKKKIVKQTVKERVFTLIGANLFL